MFWQPPPSPSLQLGPVFSFTSNIPGGKIGNILLQNNFFFLIRDLESRFEDRRIFNESSRLLSLSSV